MQRKYNEAGLAARPSPKPEGLRGGAVLESGGESMEEGCLQRWLIQNENVKSLCSKSREKMTRKVLIYKFSLSSSDRCPSFPSPLLSSFSPLLFFSSVLVILLFAI